MGRSLRAGAEAVVVLVAVAAIGLIIAVAIVVQHDAWQYTVPAVRRWRALLVIIPVVAGVGAIALRAAQLAWRPLHKAAVVSVATLGVSLAGAAFAASPLTLSEPGRDQHDVTLVAAFIGVWNGNEHPPTNNELDNEIESRVLLVKLNDADSPSTFASLLRERGWNLSEGGPDYWARGSTPAGDSVSIETRASFLDSIDPWSSNQSTLVSAVNKAGDAQLLVTISANTGRPPG